MARQGSKRLELGDEEVAIPKRIVDWCSFE
jgi:hypothetical protein